MPRGVGKLTAHYGEIVSLYVNHGLKPAQIAMRYGVQAPAIRARLKEAGVFAPDPKHVERGKKGGAPKRTHSGDGRLPTAHLQRVNREPCSFCGVNSDYGCRHMKVWE